MLVFIIAIACLEISQASIYIYSDSNTYVVGPDVPVQSNAVIFPTIRSAWSASIPGAQWIWDAPYITDPTVTQICTFTRGFYLYDIPSTAILNFAADHTLQTFVNGWTTSCNCVACWTISTQSTCDIAFALKRGWNYIVFTVTNYGYTDSRSSVNYGGLLYSLVIS